MIFIEMSGLRTQAQRAKYLKQLYSVAIRMDEASSRVSFNRKAIKSNRLLRWINAALQAFEQ